MNNKRILEEVYVLAVDLESKRPGCVLIQAAYGCTRDETNHLLHMVFSTEDWLLAPTNSMARVPGTMAQWQSLADKLHRTRNHN